MAGAVPAVVIGLLSIAFAPTTATASTNSVPVFSQDLADRTSPEGAIVLLDATATDPDGDPLTYGAVGLPFGLSINSSTGLIFGRISYSAAVFSPYSVSVMVSDTSSAVATDTFTWIVTNVNRSPVFARDLGDLTSPEGAVVSLDSMANDPDGDSLTYGAIGLPAGLTIDRSTGTITGTIESMAAAHSPYGVSVTVTDGVLVATDTFTWIIDATTRGEYTPLAPVRVVDTREQAGGTLEAGGAIDVPIAGAAGVPSANVLAVVLNVTATGATAPGYLTVWPSDQPQPHVSNVNYTTGQTVPNLVTVPVAADGTVRIFSSAPTHVVVDVEGYYSTSLGTAGGRFHAVQPSRVIDTRSGFGGMGGALGSSSVGTFDISGRADLPPLGATAVVLNVTVTETTASGYLTVFPDDAPRPLASNVNFSADQTVANLVIVKMPSSGRIDVYNSNGSTQVVVDVVGFFDETRVGDAGRFIRLSPTRLYDSRVPTSTAGGGLERGASLVVPHAIDASAYVLNLTATEPATAGYFVASSYPGDMPASSTLNFVAGQTVANLVYAPSTAAIFNSAGRTHVVIDLFGAFS